MLGIAVALIVLSRQAAPGVGARELTQRRRDAETRRIWAQRGILPAKVWEKTLAPGLIYRMEVDPNLPRTMNAVRISPQSPVLRWMPELAGKTINEEGSVKGRLTPTTMAEQAGAIVAVNGDFFSYEHGAPIGQMVRSGELITTAARPRAVFAWGPKDIGIGIASSAAFVKIGDADEVRLESVNQPLGANAIAIYTPAEGIVSPPKTNLTAVLTMSEGSFSPSTVATGTFEYALPDAQKAPVPPGKAFLIASGDKIPIIAALRAGDKVTIRLKTDGFDWEKYENEIGGGPVLVRDGQVEIDAENEGFAAGFIARNPRTAIGKTLEGDVWIVTVDGRQGCSVGATLDEMARLMRRLGCVDAINLDGGGSSALNVFGLTLGRPSDGVERSVVSGILVFGPRPPIPVGATNSPLRIECRAPASDGTVQASVRAGGKAVPNAEILWTARGAAWIDQGGLIHPIHAGKAKIFARAYGLPVESNLTIDGPAVADPKKVPAADRDVVGNKQ